MQNATSPSGQGQASNLLLLIEGKEISFEELQQLPENVGFDFGPVQVVNKSPQSDRYRLIRVPTRTARP